MRERMSRRAARSRDRRRIEFLDPASRIGRTRLTVQQARDGQFDGSPIPDDLQRQWIQGTGPGTRPRATVEEGIRNVAYALLSGADGWMFDGEDALGQVSTMSLDNQRNLRLAFAGEDPFPRVAEAVAGEMNAWAEEFLGRRIIADWRAQLDFTTRIFRPRGLHLDDRHVRDRDGAGFRRVDRRRGHLRGRQPPHPARGRALAGPLPAEDPDGGGGRAVERHAGRARGAPRARRRRHQDLRPGRAARGQLPADGDPRRARRLASSASTPAAGTTSTAWPTRWPGTRTSSIPTSTPSR